MDYLIIFLFGTIIGSFLNVVIYRVPINESIISPASHCPKCENWLKPLDLIPIISWLALKGRCRYCKVPISSRYALIELLTGVIFVLSYKETGFVSNLPIYLVLTSILIVDAFIDLDHMIIPDSMNLFGVISFFLLNFILPFIPWTDALLGSIVGILPLLLLVVLTRGNGMGLGDVKLMGMLGLFLGWKLTLLTLLLSFVLGGFFGVILLATKIKGRKDPIPFGPWITLAAFIALFWGNSIITLYLRTI